MNMEMDIILYTNTNTYINMDTIWILGMSIVSDTDMGYGNSICPILFVNQFDS